MLKKTQKIIALTIILFSLVILLVTGVFVFMQNNLYTNLLEEAPKITYKSGEMDVLLDIRMVYVIVSVIFVILSIIVSNMVSKIVMAPTLELVKSAEIIVRGDTLEKKQLPANGEKDQIDELIDMFASMNSELKENLSEQTMQKREVETILANLTDGVISFNNRGNITHINTAAKTALDITEKNTFKDVCEKLGLGRDISKLIYMNQLSRLKKIITFNEKTYTIIGTVLKTTAETADGIVIILQDITEHVRLDNMRKQFVADVSHELKTPITSILGYSDTIIDTDIDLESTKYFVKKINNEAVRMSELVTDLLTLSRYDKSQGNKEKEFFQVADMVKNLVERLEPEAKKKNQEIKCFVTANVPEIYADSFGIERVITNIITNAIKYTGESGTIEVYVGFLFKDTYIKVKDNGIGISKEDIDKVFERFYRVDSSRVRKKGGSGLGLSIAKEIMEKNNAKISIKSKLGEGTEIVLRFPAKH